MTPPERASDRAQRQIIALLDKARSTPFEAEAEAATAKAFELMARHHVDEALLEARRASDDPAGIVEHDVDLGRGPYVNGRLALLVNVCEALSVRCLTSTGPDGRIGHLIGHRSDIDRALLLHGSLHAQAAVQMVAASDAQRTGGRPPSWVIRFRRSFLFGFATTIGERLAEANAAARAHEPSSTAVVLADRSERVDEWVRSTYGRLASHRSSRSRSANGWQAGSAGAADADLGGRGSVGAPTRALRAG
jgi:hypothetical protein